jgi:hypothetical protein
MMNYACACAPFRDALLRLLNVAQCATFASEAICLIEERMTFEEKLEKLTERHEALTQSIELEHSLWNDRFAKTDKHLESVASLIEGLYRIAEIHQHRLDSL